MASRSTAGEETTPVGNVGTSWRTCSGSMRRGDRERSKLGCLRNSSFCS
jgi:hypothetical protein